MPDGSLACLATGQGLARDLGGHRQSFAGVPIAEAALIGGSLLLLSRAVTPRKIYAGIDGGLLLMFAGGLGPPAVERNSCPPAS